ncbi:hypothetical protein [Catellatospora citrea]|uniref:Uncharacterized protein n=1 Tax=Catellatospora citrea TaxID=53366 RepID=A0A8J3NZS7_9ACTN|nr:hypothetical protein [Catellatospora citrea]RKE06626.1 hypothetical protein C8E86_1447 [Catellatospora citrea]GIF98622.1 hypothetical protein Cci01nite_37160 [Catellatospora citrea]
MLIELELIARNVLLSSAGPDLVTEVWACRMLAARTPGYRSRLVGALLRLERVTDSPAAALRLAEEAVANARQIDPVHDHHATDLLIWALHALQGRLFAVDRTAEGLAARQEIIARYHPGLHTAVRCRVTACYADREQPPVADWAATSTRS